jgi:hypothetical protein
MKQKDTLMKTTIKHTMKKTLALGGAMVLALSGCSQQEMALAQTMANSAIGTSASGISTGSAMNTGILTSSDALKGVGQSQAIGVQMLANPAVVGVGAVSMAIDAKNREKNRKSFDKITNLYANSDSVTSSIEAKIVQSYNRQHGTHYTSMQQLQDSAKVQGYNEKFGTHFQTLDDVRIDYNKRHGTNYKTTTELLVHAE